MGNTHKKFYALAELGSVQLVGASSPPPGGNLDEPELHKNQALSRLRAPTTPPIDNAPSPFKPDLLHSTV